MGPYDVRRKDPQLLINLLFLLPFSVSSLVLAVWLCFVPRILSCARYRQTMWLVSDMVLRSIRRLLCFAIFVSLRSEQLDMARKIFRLELFFDTTIPWIFITIVKNRFPVTPKLPKSCVHMLET